MAPLSSRLAWSFRLSVRRFGFAGVAAFCLFVAALGLALYDGLVLAPRLAALQARQPQPQAALPRVSLPALDQISTLPGWLQQAAEAAELDLDEAQYELEPVGSRTLYRAVLPLNGSYPALRQFLAQTLNRFPNAALENLQMRRDDSTEETLQIRLVLAFHLEGKP